GEIGPLALVPRILVIADIDPRPAIEPAIAHARDEIGRQIVTEPVALIRRTPEVAGLRLDGEADAIAQPRGEDSQIASIGVQGENVGAIVLAGPGGAEPMPAFPTADRVGTLGRQSLRDI